MLGDIDSQAELLLFDVQQGTDPSCLGVLGVVKFSCKVSVIEGAVILDRVVEGIEVVIFKIDLIQSLVDCRLVGR